MRRLFGIFAILFAATAADALDSAGLPQDAVVEPAVIVAHAIAMYDQPKYPADFTHFDYVNPDAPKGGTLRQVAIGTYDSFNGFIRKGDPAGLGGLYESLMVGSLDEPFTQYGLLAETIEYPEDRSWVIFNLRHEAKWHDGVPITADDVVWTFEFLTTKGHPQFAFYYQSVVGVEKLGERRVKFTFAPGDNRELPLIMGQMTVLPKHYWTAEGRNPEETTLEPPLGSGPYKIGKFEAGRYVEMVRVEDYWGKDLAVGRGQDNFDAIRTAYVRDQLIARQMLKAGEVDYYSESQAKAWALDYNIPAVTEGRLIKEKFPDTKSGSMQNFTFNTRREIFKDRRVRLAISQAMDFEWMNKNFFFSEYVRPNSYFFPTELASSGLPSADELAILEPYRDRLPPELFTEVYQPPTTDGSGWPRANLLKAVGLLKEAGWEIRDLKLVNVASGEPMRFEILLYNQLFERVALAFKRNLTKLGIEVSVRMVDTSQYIERLDNYDFDLVVGGVGQSTSPGNEQRGYWTSQAADVVGGQNLAGIKDPVVDELVDLLIASPTRHDLVMRTRALDRVLLWGHYVIPQWDAPFTRVVYWDRFGKPEGGSFDGFNIGAWWFDPAKDAALTTTSATAVTSP